VFICVFFALFACFFGLKPWQRPAHHHVAAHQVEAPSVGRATTSGAAKMVESIVVAVARLVGKALLA
jgi:hypothetical protein